MKFNLSTIIEIILYSLLCVLCIFSLFCCCSDMKHNFWLRNRIFFTSLEQQLSLAISSRTLILWQNQTQWQHNPQHSIPTAEFLSWRSFCCSCRVLGAQSPTLLPLANRRHPPLALVGVCVVDPLLASVMQMYLIKSRLHALVCMWERLGRQFSGFYIEKAQTFQRRFSSI